MLPGAKCSCRVRRHVAGSRDTTRALERHALAVARKVVDEFEGCDYVVAPSGSCAGMIRTHYPDLFRDDPHELPRALALCERTYELTDFLTNIVKLERVHRALSTARSRITIRARDCESSE